MYAPYASTVERGQTRVHFADRPLTHSDHYLYRLQSMFNALDKESYLNAMCR